MYVFKCSLFPKDPLLLNPDVRHSQIVRAIKEMEQYFGFYSFRFIYYNIFVTFVGHWKYLLRHSHAFPFLLSLFLFFSSLTLCTFADSDSLSPSFSETLSLLCLLPSVRPVLIGASVCRRNFSFERTLSLSNSPGNRFFHLWSRYSRVPASTPGERSAYFDFGNVNELAKALVLEERRGSEVKLCDVSSGELMVVYGRGSGSL